MADNLYYSRNRSGKRNLLLLSVGKTASVSTPLLSVEAEPN